MTTNKDNIIKKPEISRYAFAMFDVLGFSTWVEFTELQTILDAYHKLFFIIDGAPCHKAKVVGRFALENASWLSLHYLPGYSPELNPDEEVWNTVKIQKLNAKPIKDKKELQSAVLGSLRSIQKRPEQIKGFFNK